MTHYECISQCCEEYATHPRARFVGYNTLKGSRMYGTLNKVDHCRCIEAPVCENLMMGLAMGMSMEGYFPVVCFERHDFILLALDALVNHVDKLPTMGDIKFPIIVRAIVGAKRPLDAGPQHTQDYTKELKGMLHNTPVYTPYTTWQYKEAWNEVGKSRSGAVVIVERRDSYEEEIPRHM